MIELPVQVCLLIRWNRAADQHGFAATHTSELQEPDRSRHDSSDRHDHRIALCSNIISRAPAERGAGILRALYHDVAVAIRDGLCCPGQTLSQRARVAAFARRAADRLKTDNSAFSYEWFYGACGLDNWGYLIPDFPCSKESDCDQQSTSY